MSDLREFFGVWEVVSGRLGSQSIPLPASQLTLAAATYRVETPTGVDHGKATWSEAYGQVALDLHDIGGEGGEQTIAAIARVRGSVLQLCYAVDGTGRPHGWEAPGGLAWVTVRYRRVE